MDKNYYEKSVPVKPESANYQSQIDLIFASKHPLQQLHKISANAPYFLDYDHSVELKQQLADPTRKEEAMAELMFLCLPQLDNLLQKTKGLGIDEWELVGVGFQKLMETISLWRPDPNKPKHHNQENLKWNVLTDTKERIKEFIAREYQLNPARFELIPLYFQIKKEFNRVYGKSPKLNDWSEIDQMVGEYTQRLPEEKQQDFQHLRFLEIKPDGESDIRSVTKDMFQVIHEQVCGNRIRGSSLDGTQAVDEGIDLELLKERTKEVLNVLNDQERQVVETYFGFRDDEKHTPEQIGRDIGKTREQVRLIIDKAERRIRQPRQSLKLRPFVIVD